MNTKLFFTSTPHIQTRLRLMETLSSICVAFAMLIVFSLPVAAEAAGRSAGETKANEKPTILTEADAGKTVTLPVGQTLEVVLKANTTTGYSWKLKQFFKKGKATQLIDESYENDPNPGGAVGVGGKTRFKFKAISEGKTKISLIYSRGPQGEAAESFSVTVNSVAAKSQ
jgi:predicted secreted protein